MDMDMDMSTENTPPNGNEWYTHILIGIICGFITLLIVRYYILIRPWTKVAATTALSNNRKKIKKNKLYQFFTKAITSIKLPEFQQYQSLDRYIINKCSFSLPFLPPIGLILLAIVLITSLLPLLIMNNDLTLNSNRAGFLAISLVPFLFASTGHYSPLALLTGMSPSTLNQFHRLLGWAIMILATVHMSCMLYEWSKFSFFMESQLKVIKVQYGLAGYGCLCLVVLGSLYPVRVFKYEIFLCTHLLAFGFIGAISKHTPYALRYFLTGIVCYIINIVTSWFVQSRLARARIHVLDYQCTKLSLRLSSPMYHTPGQYIYLCIPKISPFQWHPFTITSTENLGQGLTNTMVEVHACVRGDFTKQLYNKAESSSSSTDVDTEWTVFIGGPCGRTVYSSDPHYMLQNQKVIVISTAGAGVTYGIRLIRELATYLLDVPKYDNNDDDNDDIINSSEKKKIESQFITRDIYFIWSVRNKGELKWFEKELQNYKISFDKANTSYSDFPKLHVLFYHTNNNNNNNSSHLSEEYETTTTDISSSNSSNSQTRHYSSTEHIDETITTLKNEKDQILEANYHYHDQQSITIHHKRVEPKEWLSFASNNEPMALFVCGSSSFNRSFKNAVASLNSSQSRLVDFHCEHFDY
ncbi:FAD-binding domain-containing protein [Cunninghamella echinulata]|nr:FAD-binding domain-containing protein [Cunninghamella echinulata]